MTKQLCKKCKHLETDGMFGIFCGVGGNNTKYDCPKYEKKQYSSAKIQAEIYNKKIYEVAEATDKGIASILLRLPLRMSYEVWQHLHKVKGDYK